MKRQLMWFTCQWSLWFLIVVCQDVWCVAVWATLGSPKSKVYHSKEKGCTLKCMCLVWEGVRQGCHSWEIRWENTPGPRPSLKLWRWQDNENTPPLKVQWREWLCPIGKKLKLCTAHPLNRPFSHHESFIKWYKVALGNSRADGIYRVHSPV